MSCLPFLRDEMFCNTNFQFVNDKMLFAMLTDIQNDAEINMSSHLLGTARFLSKLILLEWMVNLWQWRLDIWLKLYVRKGNVCCLYYNKISYVLYGAVCYYRDCMELFVTIGKPHACGHWFVLIFWTIFRRFWLCLRKRWLSVLQHLLMVRELCMRTMSDQW